ncbi:MAG: metallophosphoesterase [Pirellula sp.]|jgi:predicted phosphodiesterase
MDPFLNRRNFLQQSLVAAASCNAVCRHSFGALQSAPSESPVAFFAIGDTHYFANEKSPSSLDETSLAVCRGLIDTMNSLPGTAIPEEAGGGVVGSIRGVMHAGDIIDTGDKRGATQSAMQRTEWDGYVADYGLTGTEGRLKFPVFEVHGNHDSPSGDGLAIDGLIERNRRRTVASISANGLHYSWDWGPLHCIHLGIVVGGDRSVSQKRRYNPMESLDFLIGDLEQHVGDSRRPVWLTHHVDVVRYSKSCDATDEKNLGMEWNPCDVGAYYRAIEKANIVAILYGHTHVRNVQRWNGTPDKTESGIQLLNVDNSSHFSGGNQAFFYVEVDATELRVRECSTKDAWQSHFWTPTIWKIPIAS